MEIGQLWDKLINITASLVTGGAGGGIVGYVVSRMEKEHPEIEYRLLLENGELRAQARNTSKSSDVLWLKGQVKMEYPRGRKPPSPEDFTSGGLGTSSNWTDISGPLPNSFLTSVHDVARKVEITSGRWLPRNGLLRYWRWGFKLRCTDEPVVIHITYETGSSRRTRISPIRLLGGKEEDLDKTDYTLRTQINPSPTIRLPQTKKIDSMRHEIVKPPVDAVPQQHLEVVVLSEVRRRQPVDQDYLVGEVHNRTRASRKALSSIVERLIKQGRLSKDASGLITLASPEKKTGRQPHSPPAPNTNIAVRVRTDEQQSRKGDMGH